MADIELVIKMDEEDYKTLININDSNLPSTIARRNLYKALRDSIQLPKGHGRIGDLTKLYNEIDKRNRGKNKGKYTGILALVGFADTIIEADKEDRK